MAMHNRDSRVPLVLGLISVAVDCDLTYPILFSGLTAWCATQVQPAAGGERGLRQAHYRSVPVRQCHACRPPGASQPLLS
jgi:hypothetical protein